MKSRDVFDVAVRIVGLVFLFQALSTVANVLVNICTTFPHFYFRILWPSFVAIAFQLALAYWMMQGAPWLMRLAYKKEAGNLFQSAAPGQNPSVPLQRPTA